MSDAANKFPELIAAINKLVKRSRELSQEHNRIARELEGLNQELAEMGKAEAVKRSKLQ